MEIRTEINRPISDGARDVVVDSHGQIEPVDKTDIILILFEGSAEYPFSHRRCDYSHCIIGVAEDSTVESS